MTELIDFATIKRPGKPNTFLLAPASASIAAKVDRPSPIFDLPAPDLYKWLCEHVAAMPDWTVQLGDERQMQLEAVVTTRLLKFKDDVSIRVFVSQTDTERSVIAIYSRSRLGHSDLGANRKRVEKLLDALKQKEASAA